jgi:hypothetical protein
VAVQNLVASATLGFALAFSAAPAGAQVCDPKVEVCCNPKIDNCEPPPQCDPKIESCDICHNIGGPNALGANCDAGNCLSIFNTGDAELISAFEDALAVCDDIDCDPNTIYGGIVVPFGDAAFTAHYNHGDGVTLNTFERIHATQPHVAANVGCFAVRHDPDPGN